MPHKRQKRSARDADRQLQGTDNAPTSKNEGILAGQNAKFGGLSANMYRILNAEQIRKEKKERDTLKRKREDEGSSKPSKGAVDASGKAVKDLKIMPGEKLKNFNACVLLALQRFVPILTEYCNGLLTVVSKRQCELESVPQYIKRNQQERRISCPDQHKLKPTLKLPKLHYTNHHRVEMTLAKRKSAHLTSPHAKKSSSMMSQWLHPHLLLVQEQLVKWRLRRKIRGTCPFR